MDKTKADMSKTCGLKYDEYWMKANFYRTMSQEEWINWYMNNCDKCKYMCEVCMLGEE